MMLISLASLTRYGWNIPLAEDWYFVAPLTGNERNLVSWFWAQNNEHRVPLPRLILLTALKITHGDFRAGMVLNITTLAGLAFIMIRVAQYLRGGRTQLTDAFFPVVLLHLGNWPNLLWGWQFSFVLSTALVCVLLLVLVSHRTLNTPKGVLTAGICLVLLPLCGATGLMFVPLPALWFTYCGLRQWTAGHSEQRLLGGFLIGSAIIALCLSGLYFVGYQHPTWNPPNPGFRATFETIVKFVALGLGPAVTKSWPLSVLVAFSFLIATAAMAARALLRQRGEERQRLLGILSFSGNLALFAVAMGWGRAGYVPTVGLPMRYVLLAVPTLCTAYFLWELYGSHEWRLFFQRALFIAVCLLLPFNTVAGLLHWGKWYHKGMQAIERDLLAGATPAILADKHREFLIHWWHKNQLAEGIQMLRSAGIGPFAQMKCNPARDSF